MKFFSVGVLQLSVLTATANLLGALILYLRARQRTTAIPGVFLLLFLVPWSLGPCLQGIAELRSTAPDLAEWMLMTFFLVPAAALHTACAWSGREGCAVARSVVGGAYTLGGAGVLSLASGLLELGPLNEHSLVTVRRVAGQTFLLHGLFTLLSCAIGFFWCAPVALRRVHAHASRSAQTWILCALTFLPFAALNYLAVYGVFHAPLGIIGNLLFLAVLAGAERRWNLFGIDRHWRRMGFYLTVAVVLSFGLFNLIWFALVSENPGLHWFNYQLILAFGIAQALMAHSFVEHMRGSQGPHGTLELDRTAPLDQPSDEDEGADKLAAAVRSWLQSNAVALFQRDSRSTNFRLLAQHGFPPDLPQEVATHRELLTEARRLLSPAKALGEDTVPKPIALSPSAQRSGEPRFHCLVAREGNFVSSLVLVAAQRSDSQPTASGDLLQKAGAHRGLSHWQAALLFKVAMENCEKAEPPEPGKSDTPTEVVARDSTDQTTPVVGIDRAPSRPPGGRSRAWKGTPEEIRALKELFPEIVGESPKLLAALEQTKRAAVSTLPVVIYGETGVGKELFARAIHRLSNRKGQFLAWNATSMTVELADATLFGHSKGAFTGATQSRNGYLLSCNGGTLFIDELDSLDPRIQGKLLRVLDGGDFFPVGSDEPIRVDVRLITASHHPLKTLVERKLFRNDLYFRLEGAWVFIPPLRERKEDIRLLVDHFLRLCSRDSKGLVAPNLSLTEDAWARLFAHSWPGNVRELCRVVYRAAFAARGSVIDAEDIDLGPPEDSHPEYDAFAQKLQELASLCIARQQGVSEASTTFKRALAQQALQAANGKRAAAARMLQMTQSNFSRLLRTLGLEGENSLRG